ncbi:MAG: LPS-assembly protein LptD [Flavobacteriales bacterium CG_4_10_14_0_2_um_filter_32_8]|nr:MAG: LPS-assembly protein LptD [Flavobacteriales bacterium CG_4_10_14_0_2_um_filter_32_8]
MASVFGQTLEATKIDTLSIFSSDDFKSSDEKKDSTTIDSIRIEDLTSGDALKSKVTYLAKDSIRIDIKNKLVYLFGSSEVYYENIELKSENIEINMDSSIISAKGKKDSLGKYFGEPVFKEAGQEVKSHEMRYNFKTKKGVIYNAVTHEGENFIHGDKIYKTPDDILYIKNGKYTTCNLDHPHYFFSTNKLKIIPDDKIITGPANLVIEDVPTPIAIPFGFFPNSNKQHSGLIIPTPGESAQYGFFMLHGGYYLAVSDNISSELTGDYYSKGSWGANWLTNYKKRYKFSGMFNTNYSVFKNGFKEFANYEETSNFFIKWNHTQDPKARPNSTFSANVNFGNSENYTNNFNSTGSEYLSTSFNSSVSYAKSWAGKPFNLSLNAYHNQNTITKLVTLRLPEVAFNMSRIYPFKSKTVGKQKFYEKIGLSYSMNAKNEVTAGDSLFTSNNFEQLKREFKNGMRHSIPLSTSFKLLNNFTINPAFNYSEIWYLNSLDRTWNNQNNQLKTDTLTNFVRGNAYNMSVSVSTKFFGMYQYRSKIIKALRHVVTPSVGFAYTPENNSGLKSYTDSSNTVHEYSIFENGIYGVSNTKEAGLINLGLLNNFEMKVRNRKDSLGKDTKIKLLESLNFSSSYNVVPDSLNWSNIQVEARTLIFKKLTLNFSSSFDPYALDSNTTTGQIRKVNTSEWERNGRIGRLVTANLSAGFSLNSKNGVNENKTSEYGSEQELEYIRANPEAYIDFNIPWTLSVNYNIRYSKPQYQSDVIQTLNFSGDFSLTPKWKIGFNSGYDFELKDVSYTSIDIYRDLHCWEMIFNWIPFGPRQSYLFTIKVKSAILQDLKLTRRNLPNVF